MQLARDSYSLQTCVTGTVPRLFMLLAAVFRSSPMQPGRSKLLLLPCMHYRFTTAINQSIRKGHGNAPSPSKRSKGHYITTGRLPGSLLAGGDRGASRRQASCDNLEYQKDGHEANPNQIGEKKGDAMVRLVRGQAKAWHGTMAAVGRTEFPWHANPTTSCSSRGPAAASKQAHRLGCLFSPML
jgi:hypothetical protein